MGRVAHGVGAALAAAVVLSACAVDTYDVSYRDLHQARGHEAVERGWVPEWLPEGSTDIRQRHSTEAAILHTRLPEADRLPDTCVATDDLPSPGITSDWFAMDLMGRGTAVACDGWSGVVDGVDLYIWQ